MCATRAVAAEGRLLNDHQPWVSEEVESTAGQGRAIGRLVYPEVSCADSDRTKTGRGEDDKKSQGLEGSR
jgi:hypothetical protein